MTWPNIYLFFITHPDPFYYVCYILCSLFYSKNYIEYIKKCPLSNRRIFLCITYYFIFLLFGFVLSPYIFIPCTLYIWRYKKIKEIVLYCCKYAILGSHTLGKLNWYWQKPNEPNRKCFKTHWIDRSTKMKIQDKVYVCLRVCIILIFNSMSMCLYAIFVVASPILSDFVLHIELRVYLKQ